MKTEYPHIEMFDDGQAHIEGSRLKIRILAELHILGGWSFEKLQETYTRLTRAQFYAGLCYYYDHQAEIDAKIEELKKLEEELIANQAKSPIVQKYIALLEARKAGSPK